MNVETWAESMLFNTVRIETCAGADTVGLGTGFIFQLLRGDKAFPFLVTNRHVIQGMDRGLVTFTKKQSGKPLLGVGLRADIHGFESIWTHHPNEAVDISVVPIAALLNRFKDGGDAIYYKAISETNIPTHSQIADMDAIEPVLFVGYPNGIWDSKNLLPVFRRGSSASPIAIDFMGRPEFLVDASVFPGSSGSPLFLYSVGMHIDRRGNISTGDRIWFLGVLAEVFFRQELNQVELLPIPTANPMGAVVSREMLDLGLVVKASAVVQAIEHALRCSGSAETGL